MNVCFVSNFSKTILYREIADRLIQSGINIFWIFVDTSLVKYSNNDNYLLLGLSYAQEKTKCEYDITINEILYADRYISKNPKKGKEYLINIQEPIYNFIKNNQIKYIFGERTWAHELVISRMTKRYPELNCKYLSFETVRIPSQRFCFISDEKGATILELKKKNEYLDFTLKKPDYMNKNVSILKKETSLEYKFVKIFNFLSKKNIIKDNPCVLHSFTQRLKKGFYEELNKVTYKFIRTQKFEKYENEKYIFYGMHKQPESSIDINGMYYEDQYRNIFNLWRILPPGWFLLVKEHRVGIGDRPLSFYKKIQKLDHVILIDELENSYPIIQNAQITATVTGTIALEAGLMGKNAITFGKQFFNMLPNVRNVSFLQLSDKDFFNEIVKFKVSDQEIEKYKHYIVENSFEGNVLDPVTDPHVLDEENINKLLRAFITIIYDN